MIKYLSKFNVSYLIIENRIYDILYFGYTVEYNNFSIKPETEAQLHETSNIYTFQCLCLW